MFPGENNMAVILAAMFLGRALIRFPILTDGPFGSCLADSLDPENGIWKIWGFENYPDDTNLYPGNSPLFSAKKIFYCLFFYCSIKKPGLTLSNACHWPFREGMRGVLSRLSI
uniref:Uncharacterized protein n=1 Tax=Cacopsylla melanoneura TaxID=428564 RepID=A0A8D8RLT2_9HEMI